MLPASFRLSCFNFQRVKWQKSLHDFSRQNKIQTSRTICSFKVTIIITSLGCVVSINIYASINRTSNHLATNYPGYLFLFIFIAVRHIIPCVNCNQERLAQERTSIALFPLDSLTLERDRIKLDVEQNFLLFAAIFHANSRIKHGISCCLRVILKW